MTESDSVLDKDDRLGFEPVAFSQTFVGHGDRNGGRWPGMIGQHRCEHGRSHRVTATTEIERELCGQLAHARRAATLPLRPDQPQMLSFCFANPPMATPV
jgi:hypothetical protein